MISLQYMRNQFLADGLDYTDAELEQIRAFLQMMADTENKDFFDTLPDNNNQKHEYEKSTHLQTNVDSAAAGIGITEG